MFNFKNTEEILPFLKLQVPDYWITHYVFDKTAKESSKELGKSTLDLILINVVLAFCFFYARQKSDSKMLTRLLEAYQSLRAENNENYSVF